MITINRKCSLRIITQALALDGEPFTAILSPLAEDFIAGNNSDELLQLLNDNPQAMVICNQHSEAKKRVDQLNLPDQQVILEIRQETKGVLGLQARYYHIQDKQTLELIYQE